MHTFQLPSGIEVELREMTGAEEELLTNQRLIRTGDAVNQVLKNCVLRLGENAKPGMKEILDLLSGDRLFILVKLRQISLGEEVDLELVCPNTACREANLTSVNLEELKLTPYGKDREFTFKLPGSNRKVKFMHLDGNMEKRLASLKEPSITSAMLMRIVEIDGKPPTRKLMAEMSLRDRSALRQEMARVDAGIDTVVEVDCESCGARIRTRLEAEPGFLFPGVRL
ncbi:MAG TPA: hypothetical protein VM658_13510 [bacterium]|nr:hypothetical protein [bacterium]